MAKSKNSKILAMALCASVMAGIYASPVMAAEVYVTRGNLTGVKTQNNIDYSFTGGTLYLDDADIAGALNGQNVNLGTGAITANSITSTAGITAAGGQFQVYGVSGGIAATSLSLLDNNDSQNVLITNSGMARFGDKDGANVRVEDGVLTVNRSRVQVAALSENGLTLTSGDSISGNYIRATLDAEQIANLNNVVQEDGNVVGTTVKTTSGADLDVVNNRTQNMTATEDSTIFDGKVTVNGTANITNGHGKYHFDDGLLDFNIDNGKNTFTMNSEHTSMNVGGNTLVLDNSGLTTSGAFKAANGNFDVDTDGNITAGTYNGVKIGMNEDGDIILGDGTVIDDNFNSDNVAGITRKPLDDSAPGRGNTTTIEGATSFTKVGMTTNGLSVEGTYGGFHVKDVSYNGKNNTMIYTTDKNGKETLFIDTQNGNLVSQGSLNVAGGRFIVDKDTGNMSVNAADGSAVFHVNGNDGTVHVGKVGGAQTVITGNSITTETLNVEKIVLGDKIVDKDTGDVIGGELEIGADGSVKIDNADTDAVEFNATKTALSANYGGTSLNMDSNGFNLNNGTGIDAESFVLNADGFAFKGSLSLGAGSDVKYTGGNYGTLAKLDATVKDIYDRTDGIYKDGEGNTVISNETGKWNDTTQKTEYNGEGSKVVVGDNGTTFENGAGNGTTNIDGSKITSDANGTISGGSGSSTNSIENPFGSSTSNGEETVYDGENGNTNTVNSSGMTVTNGTSTTVIDAEKVDTTTGNFSDKVTVGSEGNQTVITGGNVTVDNSVTVGGVGGTSIKHDEVRVGADENGQGGSYMNDTDVVSGAGNSLNQTAERVGHLENRVGELEDRIDKVGAMAAAIANLRTMGYDPAAPTEVAVGIGQYRDETGAALGLFHYPNRDFMLSLSVSTSGDEVMGGIGATWKFGRKSPEKVAEIKKAQAEADARRAEEAKLAKAEEMKQAAKEAKIKAQQERHAKLAAERAAQAEAAK